MDKIMKLKEIKNINCEDVTNLSSKELEKLVKKENGLKEVSISYGVYGMNGGLFQGYKTNKLYKVTARNSNLFYLA